MTFDIAIYGSGISSKIAAIALAKHDYSVCLISDQIGDYQSKTSSNLVTFLSHGSLGYLQTILSEIKFFEKFDDIRKISCQLEGLKKSKDEFIHFNEKKECVLGKIITNSEFDHFLNCELERNQKIDLIKGHKIIKIENNNNFTDISLDNKNSLSANLFILSSSKDEKIVNELGIKFINKDFCQKALSITVEADLKEKNCAFQKFTPDGAIALLPYRETEASVVWSADRNSDFMNMSETELEYQLNRRFNKFVNKIKIKNFELHNLKFNYANKLFYKNMILLGNIAHNIHPIAGQGLNLSIKDIAMLVKIISKYRDLGYELNNYIGLSEFDIERKLDNTTYSFGTYALEEMLTTKNLFLHNFVKRGLGIIQKNQTAKNYFIENATGKNFFKFL